jgi:hypothetical protein
VLGRHSKANQNKGMHGSGRTVRNLMEASLRPPRDAGSFHDQKVCLGSADRKSTRIGKVRQVDFLPRHMAPGGHVTSIGESPALITFAEPFHMQENSIVDAMNDRVGPERPVGLRKHLEFVPGSTFQTRSSIGQGNQPKFTSVAS